MDDEQLMTAAKTLARWCYSRGVDERVLGCGEQLLKSSGRPGTRLTGAGTPRARAVAPDRHAAAPAARLGPRPPGDSPAARGVPALRRGGRPVPQPRRTALSRLRWPAAPHRRRRGLRHPSVLRPPKLRRFPHRPRAHGAAAGRHAAGPACLSPGQHAFQGVRPPVIAWTLAPHIGDQEDRRSRCRSTDPWEFR